MFRRCLRRNHDYGYSRQHHWYSWRTKIQFDLLVVYERFIIIHGDGG